MPPFLACLTDVWTDFSPYLHHKGLKPFHLEKGRLSIVGVGKYQVLHSVLTHFAVDTPMLYIDHKVVLGMGLMVSLNTAQVVQLQT